MAMIMKQAQIFNHKYRIVWPLFFIFSFSFSFAADLSNEANHYPTKPIRLILPFPAGGGTDNLARIMAPKLHKLLGQPVIIDNRPGASGNIATEAVAKANPDGYTVLMGYNSALTFNPLIFQSLSFDIQKDLKPVSLLATAKYFLVVNSSVPAKSVKELIALAKEKPGELNYSSAGNGGTLHLAAELFKFRSGTEITHIPYKGGGPATLGVLTGEVQMTFGSVTSVMPHIKTGKIRAIAATSLTRSSVLPDVPTLNESGLSGFNVTSWYGLLVPKNTPEMIVTKLEKAVHEVMESSEVKESMAKQGLDVTLSTPAEFDEIIKAETIMWRELNKKLKITAN
ncbi:Tripartite-type tricarboxylate transporter, receptor component TctC [Polynucleobacter kasalickyi]|uniref:Tripartite-type tricarboxylate transporter, receptor component TctC n=2 Tax=Polynucleobacter kasalickyi TaxID=1938817 RepID=A0A1W1Z7G7_9BURK|nr:Tripartite-type tricarboxylate transporter, receptor component TctC [Polynucleobacter kasalickyi]